jgi:flavodoxin
MRGLVVYSSRTGNTKRIAEAIMSELPEKTLITPVEAAPDPEPFDWVFLGYWVDRGSADGKSAAYIKKLSGKGVALFGTLGAYPDSEHARDAQEAVRALLEPRNWVVGSFICQGRIDPELTRRFQSLPKEHPHGWTPERAQRHRDAASHPDEADCNRARQEARLFFERLVQADNGGFAEAVKRGGNDAIFLEGS